MIDFIVSNDGGFNHHLGSTTSTPSDYLAMHPPLRTQLVNPGAVIVTNMRCLTNEYYTNEYLDGSEYVLLILLGY